MKFVTQNIRHGGETGAIAAPFLVYIVYLTNEKQQVASYVFTSRLLNGLQYPLE